MLNIDIRIPFVSIKSSMNCLLGMLNIDIRIPKDLCCSIFKSLLGMLNIDIRILTCGSSIS